MKNKRLFIILSIFLVLTIIIVLCSTVFTLHTVEISWVSTTNNLSGLTNTEIVESGNFKIGESVFLINKKTYQNNLEKNNPYLKVNNIEVKFPNKLSIKVSEREELYALKVVNTSSTNGYSYVYLDYDLKVLKLTDNVVVPNEINPAVLEIKNYNLADTNFNAGDFAELSINESLISIGGMLSSTGYNNSKMKALIKNIEVNYDFETKISINTSYGLTLEIRDALNKTSQKMLKALSIYEEYHNNHPEINSGVITVLERNGDIIGFGPQI